MSVSRTFLEPHPLAMERLPVNDFLGNKSETSQGLLDYRNVPRSRGDGMEFSDSSESSSASVIRRKDLMNLDSSVEQLSVHNQKLHTTTGHATSEVMSQSNVNVQGLARSNALAPSTTSPKGTFASKRPEGKAGLTKNLSELSPVIQGTKLTPRLQSFHTSFPARPQADNTTLGSSPGALNQAQTCIENKAMSRVPNVSSEEKQGDVGCIFKSTVVERGAEFLESHSVIRELEERNSKLVEEKTKLAVQLGVQAKVNAEIKQLLVASIGEDLENRLEALVQQNAQQTVALKHWKKMSEEYAEESDRLEIECDVWRTKFLASRMLSDELSSWKATLYARHRQAQQALEKMLDERAELQQYLRSTRRSLQALGCTLTGSSKPAVEGILNCNVDSYGQSILEMASINDCLTQEALELSEQIFPPSLSATTLMLTQNTESKSGNAVEHTPAERLAIQVLANGVDLHMAEKQNSGHVMKRMGRQYIGHSHKSRLTTNSFRVTFDCCDRCKGPVIVV